jgi:hypothetical protein
MGYYGHRPSRQNNPELVARIEKTVAQGVTTMTDWERNFLGSLLESAKKWGRLTAKQHEVYQRIEKKLDPAHQRAISDWRVSWLTNPEMREAIVFAAKYYKANPPYFGMAADRILSDPDYIPGEKLYRKMVDNKYVQRAMANASTPPAFVPGTFALVRNSRTLVGPLVALKGQLVMVIDVEADVKSATKGSRQVTILPVGQDKTIVTQERYLKKSKV